MNITGLHLGRSWVGDRLETGCPCEKAACGLAISDTATDCPEHDFRAAKTMRQIHPANRCPATAAAGTENDEREAS